MTTLTAARDINAPIEFVFNTIADINNFRKAIPHITNVEFLSETRSGEGTRFKETRIMKGREGSTELEVTEYQPNEFVRLVSEAGGTHWDTIFKVADNDGATRLEMVMEATPNSIAAKLSLPLIKGMVAKALEDDMDSVKTYCEQNT